VATIGTALSRLTGFVRLGAMTYALGVAEGRLADTYNLANTTPNIIFDLVLGGILSSVLLRVYVEVKQSEGQDEAFRFISRLTSMSMVVLGGLSLAGLLAAPLIFKLYTILSPSSAIQQHVGTLLLRLFIPQLVFYGLSTISTAVLNAHRRYGVPMFAPVLNNLAVTATLIAFAQLVPSTLRQLDKVHTPSLVLLGLGTTFGVVLMGLVPWFYMRRIAYKFSLGAGLKDPRFRRLGRLSAYILGYAAINQVGLALAMILATQVQGGVTAYQYAFVFFQLPHGLLAVSIATAISTPMTEKAVAHDYAGVGRILSKGLRQIAFFILPAIAGYIAIAPQLVRLLLQHGLTKASSTLLLTTVVRFWAPGIFFFSSFYLLLRGFYALGDTRTPMFINLWAFGVNVVLDFALFFGFSDPRFKIVGLVISHSASYVVATAGSVWLIKKRFKYNVMADRYSRAVTKMILASGFTALAAWLIVRRAGPILGYSLVAQAAGIALATLAGLSVYAAFARLFKLEEIEWIGGIIRGAVASSRRRR